QRVLAAKAVQRDDQRLGRLIQRPRPVEEHSPQRPHMATREIAWQRRREISYGVVYQSDQPADHLQRPPMETRTLTIRTLLVIGAGRRIQEGVIHTDAERLFFVLPRAE